MNAPPTLLAEGSWGGEQVVLAVGPDKAVLRLGCAEGEMPAPVRLDADGRFSVAGHYSSFEAGPSTPSDAARPASFDGVLKDGRLTLTVRHGRTSEVFTLVHGMQSKVIRCL